MTSKVTSHRAAFRYHPRFGYFFRPNLRLWQLPQHERAPLYLISTNSVGARCYREPHKSLWFQHIDQKLHGGGVNLIPCSTEWLRIPVSNRSTSDFATRLATELRISREAMKLALGRS